MTKKSKVFGALLRLQLQSLFLGRRSKKRAGKGSIILFALLFLYLFAFFGFVIFGMGVMMAAPLAEAGFGWLYFAVAALMSLALGVIGSVFQAESQLFRAKDNELLLSMPIPPSMILASRMVGLYLMAFLFGGLVMIPMDIAFIVEVGLGAGGIVLSLLLLFLLPLVTLTLSVLLGWLVALITRRMRNKSLFTVLLSLIFMGAYFFFYFRINSYINQLILNSGKVASSVRTWLFPLYLFGRGAEGAPLFFLGFAVLAVLFFSLVYFVLSKSFLHIATARSSSRVRYRKKHLTASGQMGALLKKEFRHFFASPIYLLNSGLGSLLLAVFAVAALIKGPELVAMLSESFAGGSSYLALIASAILVGASGMNIVTAPSISLESRQISLLRSLPLPTRKILWAKILLHFLVTAPFVLAVGVVLDILIRPGLLLSVLIPLAGLVATLFYAVVGLLINLYFPKLDWVSEAMAVKQSFSTVVTMFLNIGVVVFFCLLFFFLQAFLSPLLFLTLSLSVLVLVTALLILWLEKKGTGLFERL